MQTDHDSITKTRVTLIYSQGAELMNNKSWSITPILLGLLCVSFLMTGCASPKMATEDESRSYYSEAETSLLEREMFNAINEYRASRGLKQLEWNDKLTGLARIHSINMASGSIPFGHDGIDMRNKIIDKVLDWKKISENVAYSTPRNSLVDQVLVQWIKSTEHHKNIIGNYNLSGIGVSRSSDGKLYFTQMFVHGSDPTNRPLIVSTD